MSEKHSKTFRNLNYFKQFLFIYLFILLLLLVVFFSNSKFALLIDISVEVTGSTVGFKMCPLTLQPYLC